MLNDTQLVENFIEASLQGKEILLANKLLSAGSVCGTNQLISRQQGVLIKVDLQKQPMQFLVRRQVTGTQWLHKLLYQHQLISTFQGESDYFDTYRYIAINKGYQFNCNTGHALWKSWREQRHLYRGPAQQDQTKASKLLIAEDHKWAEATNITMGNGLMFVQTSNHTELVYHLKDTVLWLSAEASAPPENQSEKQHTYCYA
ncbi:MAG: hypothetical protein WBC73_06390 [Phormidesmis sp.]